MQKRIPQELRGEIYEILDELVEQGVRNSPRGYGSFINERFENTGNRELAAHAIYYLRTISVLDPSDGRMLLTARGWEFWEELNTWAPWYWVKKNSFAVSVAGATIVAASVSAAANIVNLVL